MAQAHFTDFLRAEILQRKKRNPRYSERAFAKAVGLSPGFLSLLLQKRKSLSLERAKKIVLKISWPNEEKYRFLELVKTQSAEKLETPDKIFAILFSSREKFFAGDGYLKRLEDGAKISLQVTTSLSRSARLLRRMHTHYSFSNGQNYTLDLDLRDTGGGTFVVQSNGKAVGKGFFMGKICHADLEFVHPQLGPFHASVSYRFAATRIETTGRNYTQNTTFQHVVKAIRPRGD